jgi:acylphosphatase
VRTERVRVVVEGRVQGVGFRASTWQEARRLGLTGWVRNRADGRVEAVAEGPRERLDAFVAWCGGGPSFARVERIETSFEEARDEFGDFRIAR